MMTSDNTSKISNQSILEVRHRWPAVLIEATTARLCPAARDQLV